MSRYSLFACLIVPLIAVGGAASAAEPDGDRQIVFQDALQGEGFFDFRRIHPSAPERRDNWTTQITQMPDGRLLLLVWSSTTDTEVPRSNRIWHSFSTDDGETWSPPETLIKSTGAEKILNTCCYTHTDGTVFVLFNIHTAGRIDLALQTSTDSAQSWGTRRVLDSGAAQTGFLDNPIRLRSGRIVLPVYFNPNEITRDAKL